MTNSILRPEARPLQWHNLYHTQQRALQVLLHQLNYAIDDLRNRDKSDDTDNLVLSWIRHDALTRLSMLEGSRGSGKTTVLLTLLELCRNVARLSSNAPLDVRSMLEKIDPRTVWLDPIDLDMFPRSANLLAAILARLELRVNRQAAEDMDRHHQKPLQRLTELYRKVAVAWGSYEEPLEPDNLDAYATNVKRIERERMELRADFSHLLDELASKVFHRSHTDPLFVLPIDDVDLNPMRCFSVLSVLRQISVPRLFVVLLGNCVVAREMVRVHFLKDFSQGTFSFEGWRQSNMDGIFHLAELTAEAWLRKSVPPQQQIHIEDLTPSEIMLFKPAGPKGEPRPPLFELLAELSIPVFAPDDFTALEAISPHPLALAFGQRIETLLDLLLFPGFSDTDEAPKNEESSGQDDVDAWKGRRDSRPEIIETLVKRSVYGAPARIRAVPRNLADIWFRAKSIITDSGERPKEWFQRWRGVLKLALDLCLEEIAQDRALSRTEQERLSQLLTRAWRDESDLGGIPLTFRIDSEPARIVRNSAVKFDLPITEPDNGSNASTGKRRMKTQVLCRGNIVVREMAGWEILSYREADQTANGDGMPASGATASQACSRSTAAQFIIFHDLMTLSNRRRAGIFPLLPFRHPWAFTEWTSGPYGFVNLHWPHPLLNSFWEYDIFLKGWNRLVRSLVPFAGYGEVHNPVEPTQAFDALLFAWIDLSHAIMTWEPPCVVYDNVPGLLDQGSDEGKWINLIGRLEQSAAVSEKSSIYSLRLSRWLTRIALLFMPELSGDAGKGASRKTGVASALRAVSRSPALRGFWSRNSPTIQDSRTNILAWLWNQNMRPLAEQIIRQSKSVTRDSEALLRETAPDLKVVQRRAKEQPKAADEVDKDVITGP